MDKKPKRKRDATAPEKSPKKPVPDDVIETHAYEILRRLSVEDPAIAKRVNELAFEFLTDVDQDQIAESLFYDLDTLGIDDLYENSGRTRYGYVDPGEQAFEMFEDALRPYVDELKKYQELSMGDEAKSYCMGILKGLYKTYKESGNEVIDYAADAPHNSFSEILDEWKKGNKDPDNLKELEAFMKDNLPDWYQKK